MKREDEAKQARARIDVDVDELKIDIDDAGKQRVVEYYHGRTAKHNSQLNNWFMVYIKSWPVKVKLS